MKDPNFQPYYFPGGTREFDRNSIPGIHKSLSHCHDVNQKLIAANDELREEVIQLQKDLRWERAWRWGIVSAVIAAVFAAFALHFAYL